MFYRRGKMKFLYIFLIVIYFQVAKAELQETEARYSAGSESLDFCCDREYKQESAHSMSEMESHKIVKRLLGLDVDFSIQPRPSRPSRGQR